MLGFKALLGWGLKNWTLDREKPMITRRTGMNTSITKPLLFLL